ncbi:MAG TPA: hypothetical protein VMJ66_07800 [Geobacteraceae bacterium]|nr:hypothetical protein [Geobacteraceae bacterium]
MLRIPQGLADIIIQHAREGFPLEVCGILGGKDGVKRDTPEMRSYRISSGRVEPEDVEYF